MLRDESCRLDELWNLLHSVVELSVGHGGLVTIIVVLLVVRRFWGASNILLITDKELNVTFLH